MEVSYFAIIIKLSDAESTSSHFLLNFPYSLLLQLFCSSAKNLTLLNSLLTLKIYGVMSYIVYYFLFFLKLYIPSIIFRIGFFFHESLLIYLWILI